MAENTEPEGQVAETTESVETSTPVEEVTPTTSEDVWEAPLQFESAPAVENESESTPQTPESGETETPEQPETEEEGPSEEESPEELKVEDIDVDRPARLTRKKREEVIKNVIEPFRDPKTPVTDVFDALYQVHPARAEEMAQAIAESSAKAHPDLWLKAIIGQDVTLDEVKAKLAGTPTQAQTETDAFAPVEQALTELYGDTWKDASRDDEILDADLPYVHALRQHQQEEQVRKSNAALKDQEIESLRAKIAEIEPEITSIKDAHQAKVEKDIEDVYVAEVRDYQSGIEKNSLEKLFKESGLNPSEGDPEPVKALKEFIKSRFDRDLSGDFDRFISTEFSEKEKAGAVIQRVDKYLRDAAKADVQARLEKDKHRSDALKAQATAWRENAKTEKASLSTLHKKASQEYLKKLSPMLSVLEENADLKRRLSQTRPEIIGSAVTGAPDWKAKIQEAEDPWAVNDGWKQLTVSR